MFPVIVYPRIEHPILWPIKTYLVGNRISKVAAGRAGGINAALRGHVIIGIGLLYTFYSTKVVSARTGIGRSNVRVTGCQVRVGGIANNEPCISGGGFTGNGKST